MSRDTLTEGWQWTLPVRWILDTTHEPHCAACLKYAGEYTTWQQMMAGVESSEPGYFPAYAIAGRDLLVYGRFIACGAECACWIEVNLDGAWIRLSN